MMTRNDAQVRPARAVAAPREQGSAWTHLCVAMDSDHPAVASALEQLVVLVGLCCGPEVAAATRAHEQRFNALRARFVARPDILNLVQHGLNRYDPCVLAAFENLLDVASRR